MRHISQFRNSRSRFFGFFFGFHTRKFAVLESSAFVRRSNVVGKCGSLVRGANVRVRVVRSGMCERETECNTGVNSRLEKEKERKKGI